LLGVELGLGVGIWPLGEALAQAEPMPTAPTVAPHFMKPKPFGVGFGVHFGAARMTEEAMRTQGLSEFGPAVAVEVNVNVFDFVGASALIGLLGPSDRLVYTQEVVPQFGGDVRSVESKLEVVRGALAIGPRMPPFCLNQMDGRCIAVSAFAEYGKTWVSGERTIHNCVDCEVFPLRLGDGPVLAIGFDVGTRPNDGLLGLLAVVTYRHSWPRVGVSQELLLGVDAVF
jgi:hypothetical protein